MNKFALNALLAKSRDPEGVSAAAAFDVAGHGEQARSFVEGLMSRATSVRFERDSLSDDRTGKYGRALEYAILSTPEGEINVNEELIRAGYSRYLEDFGKSKRFGARFVAAQQEAQEAHRGMWGGAAPSAPVFHKPEPTSPFATRAFDLSAVDVIDADTFGLGISAPARLYNVNAPEMGAYHQRSNTLHHSVYESVISQILMRANGRGMWSGIRQAFPTNPGQFEAMKPGRPGFPGGRHQPFRTYALDTETQGLWSRSYFVDPATGKIGRAGRSSQEPLQIAELYVRRLRRSNRVGFKMRAWIDDAISDEALKRSGIDVGDLRGIKSGRSAKLQKLWDLIAPKTGEWGEAAEVGRWDPSVRLRGNVVNRTARRLIVRKLERAQGKRTGLKSARMAYDKLLSKWEKDVKLQGGKITGKRVRLAAWNATYDLSVLIHNMRQSGLGDRVDALIEADALVAKDLMDPLHDVRFKAMLEDPTFRPTITNREALNKAWAKLRRNLTDEEIARLGGTEEHVALRELADDVVKGREAFLSRGTRWAQLQANQEVAGRQVQRLTRHLEKVKDAKSLRKLVSRLKRQAMVRGPERRSALDVLNEWYQVTVQKDGSVEMDKARKHVKIFGDLQGVERAQVGAKSPLRRLGLPTQFIPGGRLEEMAELLAKHHADLGLSSESRQAYEAFVGTSKAHTAASDTEIAVRLHRDMKIILKQEETATKFQRLIAAKENVRSWGLSGARRHISDLMAAGEVTGPAAEAMAERTTGSFGAIKDAAKNFFQKHGMKAAVGLAAGLAAMWWLSNRTAEKPVEENRAEDWADQNVIPTLRESVTPWHTIWGGIQPDTLPFSNVSAFGSGRDDSKAPLPAVALPGTRTITEQTDSAVAKNMVAAGALPRAVTMESRPSTPQALATLLGQPEVQFPGPRGHTPTYGPDTGRTDFPDHLPNQAALKGPLIAPEPSGGQELSQNADLKMSRACEVPSGYAGFVTRYLASPEYLSQSRIRDQATQLHRLPGAPRTYRGRMAGAVSHYERVGGEVAL